MFGRSLQPYSLNHSTLRLSRGARTTTLDSDSAPTVVGGPENPPFEWRRVSFDCHGLGVWHCLLASGARVGHREAPNRCSAGHARPHGASGM